MIKGLVHKIRRPYKLSAKTKVFLDGQFYADVDSSGLLLSAEGYKNLKKEKEKTLESIKSSLFMSLSEELADKGVDYKHIETIMSVYVDGKPIS